MTRKRCRIAKRTVWLAFAAWLIAAPLLPAPQSKFAPNTKSASQSEITAALPVIPAARFNLTDFGAVGDGKTLNTAAFENAIAAVEKAGGGHLIVPAGTYKTLSFKLTSHMDLHLESGVVIKAPDTFAEYGIPDPAKTLSATPPAGSPESGRGRGGMTRIAPLISCAPGTTDLAITGSGTIDGSGAMFWIWASKASLRYLPSHAMVPRPVLVSLPGVTRLHVDGVTLTNSPSFHLAPSGEDITLENLHIVAPSDAPNTDALDPGGHRIVIRKCELDIGDDNVALKNGGHDILIEDLTCLHGHGISIGSGTRDGFSHVIVRRCSFDGTDNGLRIKSFRGGGGEVHDIRYSDITMRYVRRPFDINMLYNGNAGLPSDVGPRQAEPGQTEHIPNFHDIHITNLNVIGSPLAGRILGLPELPANDITFTNVVFQTARGFLVQDARDVVFQNARIDAAVGAPLVLDNGFVKFNGASRSGTSGGPSSVFYPGN
jgi:polygalacturonase